MLICAQHVADRAKGKFSVSDRKENRSWLKSKPFDPREISARWFISSEFFGFYLRLQFGSLSGEPPNPARYASETLFA